MQNSVEDFAVDGMLNMMMNNGNKVLSRIKIRCSGIRIPTVKLKIPGKLFL